MPQVTNIRRTPEVSGPHLVVVDPSLSLRQLIEAGHYDDQQGALATLTEKRYPLVSSHELKYEKELFLVQPSHDRLLTSQWTKELRTNAWELEQLREMLVLGAAYPHLQLEYGDIFAVGSFTGSDVPGAFRVPTLWHRDGKRMVSANLWPIALPWPMGCWALVSRK